MKKFKTISAAVLIAIIVGLIWFLGSYYFSDKEKAEREIIAVETIKAEVTVRACKLGRDLVDLEFIDKSRDYLVYCDNLTDQESIIVYQDVRHFSE